MPIHDVKKTDKMTYLNKTFFNVIGSGLGMLKFVGKPSQAKVGPPTLAMSKGIWSTTHVPIDDCNLQSQFRSRFFEVWAGYECLGFWQLTSPVILAHHIDKQRR